MKEARAFSPSHITGFFEICDGPRDPLMKGSRGAGISLEYGVTTTVKVKQSSKSMVEIKINGKPSVAQTSLYVVRDLLSRAKREFKVDVEHEVQVPIGAGFGSSGAGALSLALALNEALGLGLSTIEAAQVAHLAEVKCKTGLGTVLAETLGGFEIRMKPGAPGIGEIRRIPIGDDYAVVSLSLGSIPTREVLTSRTLRERINRFGGEFIEALLRDPSPSCFMLFSRVFSESIGLITGRMRKVLAEADKEGFLCSMAMIGESVFSLVKESEADELAKIFKRYEAGRLIISKVNRRGARII